MGARGGVSAIVVVVFGCRRHLVTTPVTVVRGVGSIMSPRNFPSSSSACRLSAVVVAAADAGVAVRLRRGVSRTYNFPNIKDTFKYHIREWVNDSNIFKKYNGLLIMIAYTRR